MTQNLELNRQCQDHSQFDFQLKLLPIQLNDPVKFLILNSFYFFTIFNFEKLLSAKAGVTGIVNKILSATY